MIDLFAGEQKQDWFLKMNPKHQVPVLAIDDKTFISESVVICQYLCKVAGQNSLYPGKCNNTSPGAWTPGPGVQTISGNHQYTDKSPAEEYSVGHLATGRDILVTRF